jgi:hypothetical protein
VRNPSRTEATPLRRVGIIGLMMLLKIQKILPLICIDFEKSLIIYMKYVTLILVVNKRRDHPPLLERKSLTS